MIRSLKRGVAGLATFSGRDPRRIFWPYVGVLILLATLVMGAVNSIFVITVIATTGPNDMPDLGPMVLAMTVEIVAIVALLAAAVVRRLHDTGRAGYWGLLPLPFVTFSLLGFNILFRDFARRPEGVPPVFFAIFISNSLYMAALLLLIVLLAQPTKAGANRYGEPQAS